MSTASPRRPDRSTPRQIASRFARSSTHSRWNRASSCGLMLTGLPDASRGKNSAPSARTCGLPQTSVRHDSKPAASDSPSSDSSPEASVTTTYTTKLTAAVNHDKSSEARAGFASNFKGPAALNQLVAANKEYSGHTGHAGHHAQIF